ncbi:MAG TPA: ATP-binding domain-containing protein, partial [Rhodocyclaceae bacterium]
ACREASVEVEALLYCPDYRVRNPGTAGIDPARIIDAPRREALLPTIRAILPEANDPGTGNDPAVHRFLADLLELVADVTAVVGEAEALTTRLSGGLADWARRIECRPQRLRVTGTAGSGKTQLALAVYRDAVNAGRRPLYVCYNRPLAEHIRAIVPAGGEVASYHQLADQISRRLGQTPDFSQAGAFAALEAVLDRYQPDHDQRFDVLIVDEGQDFKPDWCANLLRLLHADGSAWWLEDPMQNLYGRAPVPLADWVHLRADTNYRSPQDIVDALNRLLPFAKPLESGCPIAESGIDVLSYRDADELLTRTVGAVTRAIGAGFRRQQIAIVTYRGREHSAFTGRTRIGPYPLIAPTGEYDLFGNPVLTSGDVIIDSVHRFKGRAAACVILTEIDFAELDEQATRKLFVGATRARLKLILVIAEASENLLKSRLDDAIQQAEAT